MFEKYKKELYIKKANLLMDKGKKNGKMKFFDEEITDLLKNHYVYGIPVDLQLKVYELDKEDGHCFEKSLMIFACLDNATIVRGNIKVLELLYGKKSSLHGWVEYNGYVYDPSYMRMFKKDLYYKMFKPKNCLYYSNNNYYLLDENIDLVDSIRNSKLEDYMPDGSRRKDVIECIPLLLEYLNTFSFKEKSFYSELTDYLELIEYDENEIILK